ncbi:MAG: oxaloacetate decarboxylase [Chloroflexi bacterium]|nr:oxaloacetate decarboxylase [Chloroflexota bacterium]
MRPTSRLRQLIDQPGLIVAPGAADALVGKLIAEAGFLCVYITGAGIANTQLGVPDIGLTTMSEVVEQAGRIAQAVSIPCIADADTGYGNPINVMRTVRAYERAGLAGLHLEDQVMPKRCGHFSGKQVVPLEEMVKKLEAAVAARTDADFVIVARTDARAINGMDDAIARAKAYRAAGADMIFLEAPQSVEELRRVPREVDAPLWANMVEGGKTPLLPASELEAMGYKLVIHANSLMRVAAKAVQDALAVLKRDGWTKNLLDRMISWEERQRIVGLPAYEELERRFLQY